MKSLLVLLIVSTNIYGKSLEKIAEPYFKSSEYQRMVLNPSGKYIAAETYYDSQEHIEIIDVVKKKSFVVFNGTNGINISISDVQWIDDNSLIIQLRKLKSISGISIFKVIHLDFSDGISVENSFQFENPGYIVENLPSIKNKAYFAYLLNTDKYTPGVYLVDLTNEETLKEDLKLANKVGSRITHANYWLSDSQGKIKLIMSKHNKIVSYWLRMNNRWKKVFSLNSDSEQMVYPLGIDSDNNFIVIHRMANKDKKGVYLVNPHTLKPVKEIFYSESFDVNHIEIDAKTSDLIAIRYIENGFTHDIMLGDKIKKANLLIKEKYPNFSHLFIANSTDKEKYLYLVHNFQNDGIYVNVNILENKVTKIISKASWRKNLDKAVLKIIKYTSSDGYKIESYLSIPENKPIKALLVMPHGGPIGVRSYGFFDGFSHFLSAYGIAVLKINYRGSSGFGNKFQEAGKMQWGNKIEQDVNGVVTKVLSEFDIDKDKICSAGTSYGGYSALMLHINYPKRYKCIISMAGPTDLPLMFTSSDWNINEESIKLMTEIVGDPHHDIERLKAQSPVYNAEKINAPVLLFHGTDDFRVSVEHSVRLEYVLKKLGKDVDLKLFKGVKHGFHLLKDEIYYSIELLKFMNKNLHLNLNLIEDNVNKVENLKQSTD